MPGPPRHIPARGPGIRPRWGRRRESAARRAGGWQEGLGLGTTPEWGSRVARATATAPGEPGWGQGTPLTWRGEGAGGPRGCQPHGQAPWGHAPRPGAPQDEGRGQCRRVAPCHPHSPAVPPAAHGTAATAREPAGVAGPTGASVSPHTHTQRAAGRWRGRGVSLGVAPQALTVEPRGAMALDGVPAPDATSGGGSGVAGRQSQPRQRAAGNIFPSRRTGRLPEPPGNRVSRGRGCQHPARGAGGRRGGRGGDGTGVFPAKKNLGFIRGAGSVTAATRPGPGTALPPGPGRGTPLPRRPGARCATAGRPGRGDGCGSWLFIYSGRRRRLSWGGRPGTCAQWACSDGGGGGGGGSPRLVPRQHRAGEDGRWEHAGLGAGAAPAAALRRAESPRGGRAHHDGHAGHRRVSEAFAVLGALRKIPARKNPAGDGAAGGCRCRAPGGGRAAPGIPGGSRQGAGNSRPGCPGGSPRWGSCPGRCPPALPGAPGSPAGLPVAPAQCHGSPWERARGTGGLRAGGCVRQEGEVRASAHIRPPALPQ